jgi:hypothetical protein
MQRALACVARQNQLLVRGTGSLDEYQIAPPRGATIPLRHRQSLRLDLSHSFLAVDTRRSGDARWRLTTTSYYYAFQTAEGAELLAYHWHPHVPGRPETHLHLGPASGAVALLREAHLAAGRLSLEEVLLLAIAEFGVEPVHDGWLAALEAGRDAYREARSWA